MAHARLLDALVFCLQCYFLLMSTTVERSYCWSSFEEGDKRFLLQETIDFCRLHNPLFLARPQWMRVATCLSAYCFAPCYLFIAFVALTGAWPRYRLRLALFLGAKLNALLFYHVMEFLSDTPPQHLLPYFVVEGPYLLSIATILYRLSHSQDDKTKLT